MEYQIKHRDSLAKTGYLDIGDQRLITPNIFFIETPRIPKPRFRGYKLVYGEGDGEEITLIKPEEELLNPLGYPRITLRGDKLIVDTKSKTRENNNSIIYMLILGRQLFEYQPTRFIENILRVREEIGYDKLLYIPAIGDPSSYSLLVYMGIDLFDSTAAIIAARRKEFLYNTRVYKVEELEENPCSCPICLELKEDYGFQHLLQHNYYMLQQEIKNIRNIIRIGQLREYVEEKTRSQPLLVTLLRILDEKGCNLIEEYTPIVKKTPLLATTEDSFNRVEVKRFQRRILERYTKPSGKPILLLLPCSAKKPYSYSQSHRRFKSILRQLENPYCVHEVIITSPLGVVPRELEIVYPAAYYDIPVTGYWSEEEKKMIQDLLRGYMERNRYREAIIHLPSKLQEIVREVIDYGIVTCLDKPVSQNSLDKLLDTLREVTSRYPKVSYREHIKGFIEGLSSYQFTKEVSDTLLRDIVVKGNYPNYRIICDDEQIGMITDRGFISLTLRGAERLASTGRYYVRIHEDFTLKGNVFAPGVETADPSIRIGDEVCILQGDK
ncbi:MAG TPA: hypothetical protein ENG62_01730, partial [Thermoplasmatales archaeon]|nr:hypothetical protein [Thermoplasmatales archaeon]